jgi:hypothetical protein
MTPRKRERGAALLLVLWTFAVLTVLAAEFARAMRQDAQSTINFKQETIAHYTAIAGLNEAILAIQTYNGDVEIDEDRDGILDDDEEDDDLGEDEEDDEGGDDEDGDEDDGLDVVRELLAGRGQWVDATFGGRSYQVRVVDETGRISLNNERLDETMLQAILENLGYDADDAEIVADSILDWRDENDLHRQNGAEDDYYDGLSRPYQAKDANFDAVAELLLVRGVTREMYHGDGEVPGLKEIFTALHSSSRVTQTAISDALEYAVCGDVAEESGEEEDVFGASDGELDRSTGDCLADIGLQVRKSSRGRARLTFATLEARVVDENEHTLSHVGVSMAFRGDGFRTLQWYDSIYGGD